MTTPLQAYGNEAAQIVANQLVELPAGNRAQFLFETLEGISRGLYARTIATAQSMGGVGAGDAMFQALSQNIAQSFALGLVSAGTPPIAMGGLFSSIGKIAGTVVSAPIKVATAVAKPIITAVAGATASSVKQLSCPIVSSKAGQLLAIGAATYYTGGTGTAAAAAGTQSAAQLCARASANPAPAAPPPSFTSRVASTAQSVTKSKWFWPATALGAGAVVLYIVKR